jgi:hypothetical protein
MCAHAAHTVHALPDLRIVAGRLRDVFYHAYLFDTTDLRLLFCARSKPIFKANKVLICFEYAQADSTGTTGRDVKSIKLGKGQTVILHLTPFKYGTGTYRVRISGAAALAEHGQR